MSLLLPVILIAAILIPALALSSRFEKKRFADIASNLEILNSSLNLSFEKPELKFLPTDFPSLRGNHQGFDLSVFVETTHKNKSLIIQIDIPDSDEFNFTLREQTTLDNIGIMAGEKDIETKDIAFDRKFYLSAKDSDKALDLFSIDKIRKWALHHYSVFEKGILTFEQHQLQYRHYSPLFILKNKDKTIEIIEFMTLLSNTIKEISKTK
jgi:hypothetical protein